MREILFRGKQEDNGKWLEGNLIVWKDGSCSIEPGSLNVAMACVIPETVGQFTGLTKNGKKIFEGDVVRCVRTHCDGKEVVGHIIFRDCCFCVKKGIDSPAMDLCDDFEVIGNIHDNPELMEE